MSVSMRTGVKVEDAGIRDVFARMKGFGAAPLDKMDDAIGAAMVASTQLRFRNSSDPSGNPWKPSERARKTGGKTLVEHGYLAASITHNVLQGKGVEWGSAIVYSQVHQQGAIIHREAHSQNIFRKLDRYGELLPGFVKKSKSTFEQAVHVGAYDITIPARPFLGVSTEDEAEIEDIGVRHLASAILGEGHA
jgi:phage gpG-like protein